MSSAENESIKDFLASKQKEIEKRQNKKSKAEGFGDFVANLNIKNKKITTKAIFLFKFITIRISYVGL